MIGKYYDLESSAVVIKNQHSSIINVIDLDQTYYLPAEIFTRAEHIFVGLP